MRRIDWTRPMVGVLVAASWVAATAVTPASAQVGPITVTPSTGLTDGATAEADVPGIGSPWMTMQCPASVLDGLEDRGSVFLPECRAASALVSGTPLTVQSVFLGADGNIVRCGVEPGDCAVVAWSPFTTPLVGTTISMVPPPAFELFDTEQEAGLPVRAAVTVAPGTSVEVAQCVSPVGPDAASSTCSPPQAVTVDGRGFGDVSFPLVESIAGPAGTYSCVNDPCAVVAFDGTGTTLGSAPVTTRWAGPLTVEVPAAVGLNDGRNFNVQVTAADGDIVHLAQCAASAVDDEGAGGGPCVEWQRTQVGPGRTDFTLAARRAFTGQDGTDVTCGVTPGDCVVVVKTDSGKVASVPLAWSGPDVIGLSPAEGLLDGQAITVEASGLFPSSEYRVLRCAAGAFEDGVATGTAQCETTNWEAPAVTSTPDGSLSTTVVAAQRFTSLTGARQVCRDGCEVVLFSMTDPWNHVNTPYAMATGRLEATPSNGLQHGQAVSVAATDLMPTYDGPLWWVLQTGQWALGQCSAAVLDEASVASVFRECTVPPGGGAMTVAGSTLSATVEAQATFTSLVGKEVDCTTGPEACVALLTRVEQDARVTLVADPLTFA